MSCSNFDSLAKLALNEASIGDYMRAVKSNAGKAIKNVVKNPISTGLKGVGGALKLAGGVYSALGGTQGGAVLHGLGSAASGAGTALRKMRDDLRDQIAADRLKKLDRPEDPKRGATVTIDSLPGIAIQKGPYKINDVQKVTNGNLYIIDVVAAPNKNDQNAVLKYNSLPLHQIRLLDTGSTNAKIYYYKNTNGKMVPVRPAGATGDVGFHYAFKPNSWIINTDVKDESRLEPLKTFINNDNTLSLDEKTQQQILKAKDSAEIRAILKQNNPQLTDSDWAAVLDRFVGQQLKTSRQPQQSSTPSTPAVVSAQPAAQPKLKANRSMVTDKSSGLTYRYLGRSQGGWYIYDPATKRVDPTPIDARDQKNVTELWRKKEIANAKRTNP
jgi:hypothetical protein